MTTKLKPCPKCGSNGSLYWRVNMDRNFNRQWLVKCESEACKRMTLPQTTEKKAIAAWNRRSK